MARTGAWPWRRLGLGLAALVCLAGCGSSAGNSARLDVAVTAEAALALDQVVVTISGGGRKTYSQTFQVAPPAGSPATVPPVIWQVVIPGVGSPFVATVEARGEKNHDELVTLTADATISPSNRLQVTLALSSACRKISCPIMNQTCVNGTCQQRPMFGRADGGTLDAPMDTTADAPIDADSSRDAPVGGEASAGANGDPCTTGTGCASGNCVESVCCDKPCADVCYSCRNALTASSPSGTCAVIASSKDDPQARCGAPGAPAQCGNTSHCDGKGMCEKYGSATVCLAAACTAGSFKGASTCDGKGTCAAGTTLDCKGFACSAADGCATTCVNDVDCVAGYCSMTKTCAAKKIDGSACLGNNECVHGQCVSGVCCETACTGRCLSCANAETGAASGLCKPVLRACSCVVGTDNLGSCVLL